MHPIVMVLFVLIGMGVAMALHMRWRQVRRQRKVERRSRYLEVQEEIMAARQAQDKRGRAHKRSGKKR